jgi:hypothetical protein
MSDREIHEAEIAEWRATQEGNLRALGDLRARLAAAEARAERAEGHVAAYKRDLDAELAGAGDLRARLGARDNETFPAFVERLAAERDRAEARVREVVEEAGRICGALMLEPFPGPRQALAEAVRRIRALGASYERDMKFISPDMRPGATGAALASASPAPACPHGRSNATCEECARESSEWAASPAPSAEPKTLRGNEWFNDGQGAVCPRCAGDLRAVHIFRRCPSDGAPRLYPRAPSAAPVNQCDGCRRGLPLNEHGTHYNPDGSYDRIGCTAEQYRAPSAPAEGEKP